MPHKWPHRLLGRVPPTARAVRVALDVRAEIQPHDPLGPLRSLREICRVGRFRIVEQGLSRPGGGVEAMLLPRAGNRFCVLVDPTPPRGWDGYDLRVRQATRRHRLRFRAMHEIGHSFFYERDGGVPRRVVRDSPEQEVFADAFARALLIPPDAIPSTTLTAEDVVALHERYDVSLQVAVRAVVEAQPELSAALVYWTSDSQDAEHAAKLQWCTTDVRPCWRRVVTGASDGSAGRPLSGSVMTLPNRRQRLWISPSPFPRVLAPR
jgi:hypothetical protein